MCEWQEIPVDLLKLILAAIIGGAIGIERETHGQAAGLRTYILVSVGACLMMMLSMHMEHFHRHLLADKSVVRLDPARIASYAIASMGFLGAGAIITGRGSVRGLTTAAGLWLVTGTGLAVGAGYLLPAVFSTAISLIILFGLHRIKSIFIKDEYTTVTLLYDMSAKPLKTIRHICSEHQVTINFINYKMVIANNLVTYRLRIRCKENVEWGKIVKSFSQMEGIHEIRWEEGEVS
jgi:putative Mg2+ transporter-C (MgtC) family protein